MSCERCQNLLPDYRDRTLGESDRLWVKSHLAQCPDCRRLLSLLGETERALSGFPQLKVSTDLRRKLYAIPRRKEEKSGKVRAVLGFFPRLVRQPVFVPVAVILLAVTVFVTNPKRDVMLRAVNRQVHLGFNVAEKAYAQAGSWLDKLNSYKEDALTSLKRVNPLSQEKDKNNK